MLHALQLSLSPTSAGQQLGDYHLIRYIGEGASATIYLAEHLYSKKPVAIKVFHPLPENNHLEVFWAEAHLAACLAHPHIVSVLDYKVVDAVPFLVMEYAPYGTLRSQYEAGRRLLPSLIYRYVNQIASALQYIHDRGFVHQDVKPENLLLGHEQRVLLSDFGISIAFREIQKQSKKKPIGTILYTAPEQIQGRSCPASDQYALGVLVYEWLCGRWPFQGTSYAIAHQHLHAEAASICAMVPTVPLAMEKVVLKALAKDPMQRFASIEEFAQALEQAYRDVPM